MSALSLVAFGITSHLLFAIGVGAMAIQLYNGLATPLVALPNWSLLVLRKKSFFTLQKHCI